jgi:predicted 3-demethylubiquinone-9 3-methyltransferase (glyoxalase superfamily)
MPDIAPCLWYDHQGEDAAKLYVSLFPNSKIGKIAKYPANFPHGQAGKTMTVEFELDGKPFLALNGGPHFKFTEAVSFQIFVQDQGELDHYWDGLIADGGEESQCGWLKDRFGLSWQVTPAQMAGWVSGPNGEKVMAVMMTMGRLDVARLEAASKG